ncbi:MAG: arsenite methyltransferase [Planctomycetota bacterium]|jgi:ubiquinone/menaquinone biosynthesis C-methylase UbiE
MGWLSKLKEKIALRAACRCHTEANSPDETRQAVRESYAGLIKSPPGGPGVGSAVAQLAGYTDEQLEAVPAELRQTVFACGNPVAHSGIKEGQVVLDIGSGAGLDVLLASEKVGPGGKVIGLDMTPEMIETARANARKAGASNVEFTLGDAEAMPVEAGSCDWVISNCVINLAPDKSRVFAEAFRVLKGGGRLMISDIVTHDLPAEVRQSIEAWTGCVGGALEEDEYLRKISEAGFQRVEVLQKKTYDAGSLECLAGACCGPEMPAEVVSSLMALLPRVAGRVSSILVSAVKP